MNKELIYLIGEAIMMEIEEVEYVTYPQEEKCDFIKIVMRSGKRYELILKAI